MKRFKSKNKVGVYYSELTNGDKSFYFTYKDFEGKKKWVHVGKYSEGIRENVVVVKRNEQLSKMKHGEDITIVANKKKSTILTVDI